MKKVRFGILSSAKIGVEQVIPAMMNGSFCEVTAIASRNPQKAAAVAAELGIAKHYGSYDDLLADPEIDAVYNPLPNHLHVPLTLQALRSGKHVLCEKPVALSAVEAQELLEQSRNYPGLKIMEAFMYRFHPRWDRIKELISQGEIGEIKAVHSFFSYFNDDPENIRNDASMGGGGLMDIGCYSISSARYIFGKEPVAVAGVTQLDDAFGVDRLASGLLDFGSGTCVFSCTMRSPKYQYLKVFGTHGHIHVPWPFNPEMDRDSELSITIGDKSRVESFPPANHYTLQGDHFARSILDDTPVPTPLEDAVANMEVIDAILA